MLDDFKFTITFSNNSVIVFADLQLYWFVSFIEPDFFRWKFT